MSYALGDQPERWVVLQDSLDPDGWRYLIAELPAAGATTLWLSFQADNPESARVWLDDIELYADDPLLDAVPSAAAAAYSVATRLRSAHDGSGLRVRRDSDQAELDVPFTASDLADAQAIADFCGDSDGPTRAIASSATRARCFSASSMSTRRKRAATSTTNPSLAPQDSPRCEPRSAPGCNTVAPEEQNFLRSASTVTQPQLIAAENVAEPSVSIDRV